MSFFDIFRNILGIRNRNIQPDPQLSDPYYENQLNKPVWMDEEEDDEILSQHHGMHSFPVLTDPLEIHRYFEQQMQEMMKSFSMFSSSPFFEDFPGGNESKIFGAIEQPKEHSGDRNLREHYLKKPDHSDENIRRDMDLDARVNSEGLGKIMEDVTPGNQVTPAIPSPKFRFFGESIISHTIRKPDGSIETRTTKKRSDGTEETVVSVQKPDGSEDVHSEKFLIPRDEASSLLRSGAEEGFLTDILKDFFGK